MRNTRGAILILVYINKKFKNIDSNKSYFICRVLLISRNNTYLTRIIHPTHAYNKYIIILSSLLLSFV